MIRVRLQVEELLTLWEKSVEFGVRTDYQKLLVEVLDIAQSKLAFPPCPPLDTNSDLET
jgi:hypothetical protein